MSGIIAAGSLVAAGAIGKGVTGYLQNRQASNIEKNNIRPVEQVDPIYQQNVNEAEQMARQGLPQEVINNQLRGINQNQAQGISAASRSANPGASISSIVRQGDLATGNLNAEDAAARNRNTLMLLQQRGQLVKARQDAWNYNYADKYSENLAKSQALRGAGMQNEAGAFTQLGQAGMGILGSEMNPLGSAGVPATGGNTYNPNANYYNFAPVGADQSTTS